MTAFRLFASQLSAHPLLLAVIAVLTGWMFAAFGLVLGTITAPQQIGLIFNVLLGPMIFFGCTYYPWEALRKFPILSRAVLVNPVVYASEGFRSALVPQFAHLPAERLLIGLVFFNILFITVGLRQFRRKALT